jgi:hypothetical protein
MGGFARPKSIKMRAEKFFNPSGWHELPELLESNGIIKLRPASDYQLMPRDALRIWCHYEARYGIVTEELIEWLRQFIGGRNAIEVGSGAGDLAYHLKIPATDNRMQEWPEIKAH